MPEKELGELKVLIQELKSEIQGMDNKQDEMMADIKSIKDVVYNPETGLYARVRDHEKWQEEAKDSTRNNYREALSTKTELQEAISKTREDIRDLKEESRDLDQWRVGMSKFIWGVGLTISGLLVNALFGGLISG